MDQEGQIKHSSSGLNHGFDDEDDDADDDVFNGDHDVDDILANAKESDYEIFSRPLSG